MKANQTKIDNQNIVQKKENAQEVENKSKNSFLSIENSSKNPLIAERQTSSNPWINPNQVSTNPFLPKNAKSVNPFLPIQKKDKEEAIKPKETINTEKSNTFGMDFLQTNEEGSKNEGMSLLGHELANLKQRNKDANNSSTLQKKENPFLDTNSESNSSFLSSSQHSNPFLSQQTKPDFEGVARDNIKRAENNSNDATLQRAVDDTSESKANQTGMPNQLKQGIENLSGIAMDDVRVHYNSNKPAQLQAYAYAQGADIHLGSGQEKHLPHEAWHVVQQKQGRVKPTIQMKDGFNINDDDGLEKEADVMGAKALQIKSTVTESQNSPTQMPKTVQRQENAQLGEKEKKIIEKEGGAIQAKLKNASVSNEVAQMAFVARRDLDFLGASLLRKIRDDAFHEHIFFEDNGVPPNIGFHDGGLYQENYGDFPSYEKVSEGLDDARMRAAVEAVGDPGVYALLGNNCQAYVDEVMSHY